MKRTALIPLLALAVLAFAAVPASAQQNEVGIFMSVAQFDSTTFEDAEFGDDVSLDFEGELGWGASYNRYFGEQFSLEFGAQQINSTSTVSLSSEPDFEFDFADVDLTTYTVIAQWHFGGSDAMFAPYIGGGIALVSGQGDLDDEILEPGEDGEVDFEGETTFVANAGLDLRFGGVAIFADAKYVPYEAVEEGLEEDAIDLNPLVFAAGVKFRF